MISNRWQSQIDHDLKYVCRSWSQIDQNLKDIVISILQRHFLHATLYVHMYVSKNMRAYTTYIDINVSTMYLLIRCSSSKQEHCATYIFKGYFTLYIQSNYPCLLDEHPLTKGNALAYRMLIWKASALSNIQTRVHISPCQTVKKDDHLVDKSITLAYWMAHPVSESIW